MESLETIKRPSKQEQKIAIESYNALLAALEQLNADEAEIEIEETKDKIVIPLRALKLLGDILKSMSQGKPISIIPIAAEVTTQKAAEILGCSRPYFIKLLDEGKIPFTKIGRHRRIKMADVLAYKEQQKQEQKKRLIKMMQNDEALGLYDS